MRCLILILALEIFSYGDIMYEMSTITEGMMGTGCETTMRICVKGDCSRTDINSKNSMVGDITNITITRLDKKLIWSLDSARKQYSVTTFGELMKSEKEKIEEVGDTIKPEVKVEKTGKKKTLLGHTCEEVTVSMNIKSNEGHVAFTQTLWVAKDIEGYDEIENFNKKLNNLKSGLSSPPIMGVNMKSFNEFQKKVSEISGFPLEFNMNMTLAAEDVSFSMKMRSMITKIETKPLNQKIFEIPAGYFLQE